MLLKPFQSRGSRKDGRKIIGDDYTFHFFTSLTWHAFLAAGEIIKASEPSGDEEKNINR
jgi:hypothetical protein